MKTQDLYISSSGVILSIGDIPPELEQVGLVSRHRASSIVPVNVAKRIGFVLLRLVFGERGAVAEWTRAWQGPWLCTLFATGERYVHQSRRCCLAWEHERLEELYEKS